MRDEARHCMSSTEAGEVRLRHATAALSHERRGTPLQRWARRGEQWLRSTSRRQSPGGRLPGDNRSQRRVSPQYCTVILWHIYQPGILCWYVRWIIFYRIQLVIVSASEKWRSVANFYFNKFGQVRFSVHNSVLFRSIYKKCRNLIFSWEYFTILCSSTLCLVL